MNNGTAQPLPSVSRLLGEALENWIGHQGRFWIFAAPAAVVFAIVPWALIRFGLPPPPSLGLAGIRTVVVSLILYQWFKYALYDDWDQRRAFLWRQKGIPWTAFVSVGFVLYWLLQLLMTFSVLSAWGRFVMSQMPSGNDIFFGNAPIPWVADVPIVPLNAMVLAALFGSFLLFLPARAAGTPWGPIDAFRKADGLRSGLIAIAMLLAFMSLVGAAMARILVRWIAAKIYADDMPESVLLASVTVEGFLRISTELLVLYVLARVVTGLFVSSSGWRAEVPPLQI